MAFAGKVAVVAGTSGIVGSGIARAFLAEDAIVIAPVRSKKSVADFVEEWKQLGKGVLDVVEVDVGSESGAKKLADHVKAKYTVVDHAVSSIGAWWQGGVLTSVSLDLLNEKIQSFATSHFVFAKAILPLLKQSDESSYTIVTGGAGEKCFMPQASLVTVGAAALFGISLALRAEYQTLPQRINELRIYSRIERHDDALANESVYSNRAVGRLALSIAGGNKKGEVVPGTADTLTPRV